MRRLRNLLSGGRAAGRGAPDPATVEGSALSTEACFEDLRKARESLDALQASVHDVGRLAEQLLAEHLRERDERVQFAAIPQARLLSDSIRLTGSPGQRTLVRRRSVGRVVEAPFSPWMGVTRCATNTPDVRGLWERLLESETACVDDLLRSAPSTILDVPGSVVSSPESRELHVRMGQSRVGEKPAQDEGESTPVERVVAVPRFTYDLSARKLRNFGHFLLDCMPQVVALSSVAPDAVFLLPQPLRGFQQAMLALFGLTPSQIHAWDGSPVLADRLLVLESDGRTGGGRPLSSLLEMRARVAAERPIPRGRRVYVSRRDARRKRQWVSDEARVEDVFRSRGFEILVMGECPLERQTEIFREAAIVAGISGAGLADMVFSAPGTHVIVLLSDSLMRWYADEIGHRSAWSGGRRQAAGQLASLGDSPRFYAHLAAAFEQYCHCFVGDDDLSPGQLPAFVDDVLARVEAA